MFVRQGSSCPYLRKERVWRRGYPFVPGAHALYVFALGCVCCVVLGCFFRSMRDLLVNLVLVHGPCLSWAEALVAWSCFGVVVVGILGVGFQPHIHG